MKRTTMAARYAPLCTPIMEQPLARALNSEDMTISCYENEVPAFIEVEMHRLYGSLYSSLVQFRIYNNSDDTSTYIVRRGENIITIFLFRKKNNTVYVINEVLSIDAEDISRFVSYIFTRFAVTSVIHFKSVQTGTLDLVFPYQRVNHLEDIVVTLPDTKENYRASLGKNTRRNIKRYTKKLTECFPSICYQVFEKGDVDFPTIRDIVTLNKSRMADKNKVSNINEADIQRLFLLAQKCGLVGVVKIDGKICAGGISFSAGSNYFLSVLAHDPAYDDCWLGILCCYWIIGQCIDLGGKEFHFLWGRYEYKYTLLGVKRDLDNVVVYRSYAQLLRNSHRALRIALHSCQRQVSLWLQELKRQDTAMSRLVITGLKHLRHIARK